MLLLAHGDYAILAILFLLLAAGLLGCVLALALAPWKRPRPRTTIVALVIISLLPGACLVQEMRLGASRDDLIGTVLLTSLAMALSALVLCRLQPHAPLDRPAAPP